MKEKSGKNESALGGRRRERVSLLRLTSRRYCCTVSHYSCAVRVRSQFKKPVCQSSFEGKLLMLINLIFDLTVHQLEG